MADLLPIAVRVFVPVIVGVFVLVAVFGLVVSVAVGIAIAVAVGVPVALGVAVKERGMCSANRVVWCFNVVIIGCIDVHVMSTIHLISSVLRSYTQRKSTMHTILYGIIIGTAVALIIINKLTETELLVQHQHGIHPHDDTHESEEHI